MLRRRVLFGLLVLSLGLAGGLCSQKSHAAEGWKAAVSTINITPKKSLWMAGYGGRTATSSGKEMDIWAKIVVLEDAKGHRGLILSSDTLGIPQTVYDNVCTALKSKHKLERSQIMLNSSHTHCGPVLRGALLDIYPLTSQHLKDIEEYTVWLEKAIIDAAGKALANLAPAKVRAGEGRTDFAVNRRTNREPDVPMLREKKLLKGPVDHSVPVLAVSNASGKLIAVVFGYACHNTVMGYQKWSGDYAGFAQNAIEKKHPGAAAMFHMGCGADQNPLPRRSVALAQKYGEMLAKAVDEVLAGEMKDLPPTLKTEFEFVNLKLGKHWTREQLVKMAGNPPPKSYTQRYATRLLKELDQNKPFPETYPYPVQGWLVGGNVLWITLGGEVVVDYALRFKQQYPGMTWVTGYCNDVMAYIPSLRVLKEGGYEGASSMFVYGLPCERWDVSVEDSIAASVGRLVAKLKP